MNEENSPLTRSSQGWPSLNIRERLQTRLESPTTHWIILSLVLVDFSLSMVQVILTVLFPGGLPNLLVAQSVLSSISLGITIVFALELLLHISIFGYRYYLSPSYPHWFLHLLDAVIIIVTLTLQIVYSDKYGLESPERQVVGLLIVFRLWRFIKILEAVAVGVGRYDEDHWGRRVQQLELENDSLRRQVQSQQNKIRDLENQIGQSHNTFR